MHKTFYLQVIDAFLETHSKTLTGMQQNIYITNLVKRMARASRQMAELLTMKPKMMRHIIQKMKVHGIIIKTDRTRPSLWKLNPIKMPKWVNPLI
jgi:hypothetical protein